MTATADTEVDRWLTLERIARSDLMALLFDGFKAGAWDAEATQTLALSALHGFGNGCCYFLASAVAGAGGLPIAGFRRDDGSLVHAAVVDPGTGEAADILGRRPLAALRAELVEAAGPLRLAALPTLNDEMAPVEASILREIAAGMPWMPRTSASSPALPEWERLLVAYANARLSDCAA